MTGGAILAAQRATAAKEKAEKALIDKNDADVAGHIGNAQEALIRAEKHEQQAKEAKQAARDRLDKVAALDESNEEILHRWRTSNRVKRLRDPGA